MQLIKKQLFIFIWLHLPLVIWCLTVQAVSFVLASESSLLSDVSPDITYVREVHYSLYEQFTNNRRVKCFWDITLYARKEKLM